MLIKCAFHTSLRHPRVPAARADHAQPPDRCQLAQRDGAVASGHRENTGGEYRTRVDRFEFEL
jgi:hypothetical protein